MHSELGAWFLKVLDKLNQHSSKNSKAGRGLKVIIKRDKQYEKLSIVLRLQTELQTRADDP